MTAPSIPTSQRCDRRPSGLRWTTILAALLSTAVTSRADSVALAELNLEQLHVAGWQSPRVDRSFKGKPLSIAGRTFERGIGTCATSTFWLELDGRVERFRATIGVDDDAARDTVVRMVIVGDDRMLWDSGPMRRGEAGRSVDIPLAGVRSLLLAADHVGRPGSQNFVDWVDARLTYSGARPVAVNTPREKAVILTPKPPLAPRINSPKVYGCRPGSPFVYRIPTTGERPIRFEAEPLPAGLHLDAASGILTGTAPPRGTHVVRLRATNRHGEHTRPLRIVSGDTLALTPPMGWNHWYAHYARITDAMVREAADIMVRSGMADVGYSYVNLDDCWMNAASDTKWNPDPARVGPFRDASGNMLPNVRFPDMRALTDYIHARGLKAGLYTSPGPQTCAGFAGSYRHEEQDARQFAAWGFDFLKYDWCTYRTIVQDDSSLAALQAPYRKMGELLRTQPRDIVLNLCQGGRGDVWRWGTEVGGQSWRIGGDLGGELNRIFPVALQNAGLRAWCKPGSWNDPDYIQIGYIGLARTNGEPRPCPLTPTEQYAFMSLWSLMAAPLFFSGDMTRLDEFTLNILCNHEVIAINQDSLGECARVVPQTSATFVMVKNLDDGSKAVGLCNGDEIAREVTAVWRDLGIAEGPALRDVWPQRDLGRSAESFRAKVPRHGVVLLRVTPR